MAKVFAVVNPRSAGGQTGKRWPRVFEALKAAWPGAAFEYTRGPMDAPRLVREALGAGADMIVSAGGDGAHNEVMNGFFTPGGEPIGTGASLAILPLGTGGDLRKTLDLPADPVGALDLLAAPARAIDVGRLRLTGPDGQPGVRMFINIASFGLGGLVDDYVNHTTKVLGGKISFYIASFRAALRYTNAAVRVTVDGGAPWEGRISNIAVCNGQYFGGGMRVGPMARMGDGQFEVVTLGDMTFGELLGIGRTIYTGGHMGHAKVRHVAGRVVVAEALEGPVLLDVDGEQPGRLPCRFELLPGALRVHAGPRAAI